jgi:hypothetical protein
MFELEFGEGVATQALARFTVTKVYPVCHSFNIQGLLFIFELNIIYVLSLSSQRPFAVAVSPIPLSLQPMLPAFSGALPGVLQIDLCLLLDLGENASVLVQHEIGQPKRKMPLGHLDVPARKFVVLDDSLSQSLDGS